MNKTIRKLGVFDSGVGGLTVLKELLKLPIPEFVYVADTANVPYGEKTAEQIILFTTRVITYLTTHNVDAVVIACHTASAIALEHVQRLFPDVVIIGVVEPVVSTALITTTSNRIGVIGTPATIASTVHERTVKTHISEVYITAQACPRFVPLIEDGLTDQEALMQACSNYLAPIKEAGCDTLIIGCTHYELIHKEIASFFEGRIRLIQAPSTTATLLETRMAQHTGMITPHVSYYTTGNTEKFKQMATQLTGLRIEDVNWIDRAVHERLPSEELPLV